MSQYLNKNITVNGSSLSNIPVKNGPKLCVKVISRRFPTMPFYVLTMPVSKFHELRAHEKYIAFGHLSDLDFILATMSIDAGKKAHETLNRADMQTQEVSLIRFSGAKPFPNRDDTEGIRHDWDEELGPMRPDAIAERKAKQKKAKEAFAQQSSRQ